MSDGDSAKMMSFMQDVSAEFLQANPRREVVFEAGNAGRSFDFDLVRVRFGEANGSLILEANADDEPPDDVDASDVAEEIAKRLKTPDTADVGAKIQRITDPPVKLERVLSAVRRQG